MNLNDILESTKNLLNPSKAEAFLSSQLPKAAWTPALINYGILLAVNLILRLISLVVSVFLIGVLATFLVGPLGIATATTSLVDGLISIPVSTIVSVIVLFASSAFLYLIAKLFGGKGTFVQQFYLQSVIVLGLLPVNIILDLLSWIPCVNCVVFIALIVLLFYILYLWYLVIKVSHSLDGSKALMVLGAYILATILILVIIFVLIMLLNLGAALGLSFLPKLIK